MGDQTDSVTVEKVDECDILDTSQFTYNGDFKEQVQEIFYHIRLTRQEVEDLQDILDDMTRTFSAAWHGTVVMPFGSIITGLGIKCSDVDCYVQLPDYLQMDRSMVLEAKRVLMKHRKIYHRILAIHQAKVPIIKLIHKPTMRNCDISFQSYMGVQNSKLIAYLLDLDERFLRLAILIKYWSKVHCLTGTNLLSSYGMTLMVIFYLQQKSLLPPIAELQNDEWFIDGWNAAFDVIDYTTENTESLYQLVGGFFKFYKSFKFDQSVISTYVGKPIPRSSFTTIDTIPPEFELYKSLVAERPPLRLDTFICIQDPIEHNRNCAMSVYPKLVHKLLLHFAAGNDIFEKNDEKNFLINLLNNSYSINVNVKKKKPKKPKQLHGVTKPGLRKVNANYKDKRKFNKKC